MRLLPESLLGRVIVLIAAALLVAQLVNLGLLLNEREKLRLAKTLDPAIGILVGAVERFQGADEADAARAVEAMTRRGARFEVLPRSVFGMRRVAQDSTLEARIRSALEVSGLSVGGLQAGWIAMPAAEAMERTGGPPHRVRPPHSVMLVAAEVAPSTWLNARLFVFEPGDGLVWRLFAATFVLYAIVLAAAFFVAMRLAGPLRDLTAAAERFSGQESGEPLSPRGPADVRRAMEAFNSMRARIVELLREKDQTLGAIGHDLRTPLASLRIRAENVDDEAERARMVATIGQMSQTLDDVLTLSRSGRPAETRRPVDVTALVDDVVEEFREAGAEVAFAPAPRLVATLRPNGLKRALRNLVDNAVKYGGSASVSVSQQDSGIVIAVEDDGPGIAADQIEQVTQAFYRVEGSRSRETGGIGLGLAIARSLVAAEGGRIELANRQHGGLRATLCLPAA